MKIVPFPHPTLRRVSKPLKRVDAELKDTIRQMFDLMYQSKGVGLAANQVDIPLRFFICNMAGEAGEGEELVFLNPTLSRPKGLSEHEEGCLSLPGVYAPVKRPASVRLHAYSLTGEPFEAQIDGLLARIVQHETDHLDGTLFIDRLSQAHTLDIRPFLDEFELAFTNLTGSGEMPGDEQIAARWKELEDRYS